ncbi:tRNA (adenosine(37)-N6)-threonylcarbamoyltransferase complex ATPase subunit type 1 TsaE [Imbroritus primus]|uniref:tRNA (adenosine(37)-N6)-threonylcarbamoyltransferase complex ATPase subunit type 1 TsaE n=1 Tax=Imbroritus primus TaxID=3058603 RepID=UPI003D1610D7
MTEPCSVVRQWSLADMAATDAWGARLAAALRALSPRPVQIQLSGDLGAGKTTLSRAILRALGHAGRVRSPTYTLCEPYALQRDDGTPLTVYHFDLYRFAEAEEWIDAGFGDLLAEPAVCLIEWPEKAAGLLGEPDLHLWLQVQDQGGGAEDGTEMRALRACAYTSTGTELLHAC